MEGVAREGELRLLNVFEEQSGPQGKPPAYSILALPLELAVAAKHAGAAYGPINRRSNRLRRKGISDTV